MRTLWDCHIIPGKGNAKEPRWRDRQRQEKAVIHGQVAHSPHAKGPPPSQDGAAIQRETQGQSSLEGGSDGIATREETQVSSSASMTQGSLANVGGGGLLQRDEAGVLHVVALSGGHDSSALALLLNEREPRPYTYICTPTGDESPEMFAHWRKLGEILGSRIKPIMAGTLDGLIASQSAIPNFHERWCTRILKIEPFIKFLKEQLLEGPVVAYVGLRADEPTRVGGVYGQLGDIETRCPLREWGYGEEEVQGTLQRFAVTCPDRTDCLKCYHQRIGEWWECWDQQPTVFDDAIRMEAETGHTFRTPKLDSDGAPIMVTRMGLTYAACWRDSWPVRLADMKKLFEAGFTPDVSLNRMKRERQQVGQCRSCSL